MVERATWHNNWRTSIHEPAPLPLFAPSHAPRAATEDHAAQTTARPDDLQFDNGLGGFSPDGKEYVIYLPPGEQTPAPWINVVANAHYGFLASESGGGYTWAVQQRRESAHDLAQ